MTVLFRSNFLNDIRRDIREDDVSQHIVRECTKPCHGTDFAMSNDVLRQWNNETRSLYREKVLRNCALFIVSKKSDINMYLVLCTLLLYLPGSHIDRFDIYLTSLNSRFFDHEDLIRWKREASQSGLPMSRNKFSISTYATYSREKTERCHGLFLGDPWKRYSLYGH